MQGVVGNPTQGSSSFIEKQLSTVLSFCVLQIGTNGVFSFGYRETGYWHRINNPSRFYAAPFWGDVDISDGGDIFYEIHTAPSLLIDQVSSLVSFREGIEFSATWMIVAYWREVQQFSNHTPQVCELLLGWY